MVGTLWNNIHDGMIAKLSKRFVLLPIEIKTPKIKVSALIR
jgi:hypothetical protein